MKNCETCRHDLRGGREHCRLNVEHECEDGGGYECWEGKEDNAAADLIERLTERIEFLERELSSKPSPIIYPYGSYVIVGPFEGYPPRDIRKQINDAFEKQLGEWWWKIIRKNGTYIIKECDPPYNYPTGYWMFGWKLKIAK